MVTYIISGGNICDTQVLEYLEKEEHIVIAADRGVECCQRLGIIPDYLIGDFDSISKEAYEVMQTWKVPINQLNPIKDDTDTEAAIRLALEKTQGDIMIFGGTGSRLDHVLGNISILGLGFAYGRKIYLIDETNRIQLIDKECVIEKDKQFGTYVSVCALSGTVTGLTEEGFYYPLNRHTLEGFTSLGISNEIVADVARITIEDGVLIVIESKDK